MPPIILLCSRDLTKSELIQINKYFSTLQYNKYYHADKVASTAPFECIIVNLSSSASRDWWSVQGDQNLKLKFPPEICQQFVANLSHLTKIYIFCSLCIVGLFC